MYDELHGLDDDTEGCIDDKGFVPYVWNSIVPMCAWIDAGMHHIFHGVVARIMLVMEEVMSGEDKKGPFEDIINPYLIDIADLRLDWLHMKQLPKTQWLAEDELGFARIMLFVYGQFFLNVPLKRNSNTTKGTFLSIRQMIVALHVMIALLMSPVDPVVNVIDRHIKIFLSCCQRFTHLYYHANHEPFWSSTSNFPSLLNLAAQIQEYGPIRWYWEGTRERYIQTVKKVLISMRKTTSYFTRKMVVLQKVTVIAWLKDKLRRKMRRGRGQYNRMYYRYESLSEVEEKYENGEVLSGVTTKTDDGETLDDYLWIAFGKKGKKISIVPLRLEGASEGSSRLLCGFSYHKYILERDEVIDDLTRQELDEIIADHCVLLPYNDLKNDSFDCLYGVVFSDWEVLNMQGVKCLPVLCRTEFSVDAMTVTD